MKKLGALFLLGGLTVLWHLVRDSQPPVRPQVDTVAPINTQVPLEPGSQEIVSLQRVENYYAPHYVDDELVWETRGDRADVFGEDRALVQNPNLVFYEKRRADGSQRTVSFTARKGELHKRRGNALLGDGVTAVTDDATKLETSELQAEFLEKRLFTESEVHITRPRMEIRGRQLDSSIKLEKFSIRQGVRMVLHGTDIDFLGDRAGATPEEEEALAQGEPAPPRPVPPPNDPAAEEILYITSDGPLTMERTEKDEVTQRMRHRVTLKDNVLLLRQQFQEVNTTLATDTLEIVFLEADGADGQGKLSVEVLHASGNTRMTDRRGTAESDSLIVVNDDGARTQTMSFRGPYKWFTLETPQGFSLTPGGPSPSRGDVVEPMEITCAGNARFIRGRKGSRSAQRAEFDQQVLVKNGGMSLLCKSLAVDFAAPDLAAATRSAPEVSALTAGGDVLFVDEQVTARADQLDWNRAEQGIRLSGERPAEVLQGRNRLSGRRIVIDQAARLVTCEEDATSIVQLARGAGVRFLPGGPEPRGDSSWRVTSKRQEFRFGEGMRDLESLVADGEVVLDGSRQRAQAEKLTWTASEDKMVLKGKPGKSFARIVDGDNTVESSAIEIRPKRGLVRLVGKKLVTVTQISGVPGSAERRSERITITCTGDAVVTDGGARMHFLRDVVVKRQGGRVRCDRLLAFVNTERNEVERVLANGNVVVSDRAGSGLASYLAWNMTTRELLLKRHPYAQVWRDGSYFFGEEIKASQDWRNVTAANYKGRGRILVREGAKLSVPEEKPAAPTRPRPGPEPSRPQPNQPDPQPKPESPPDRRRPDRR